jgi:transcriptional regulator with XRE-family HTH domain
MTAGKERPLTRIVEMDANRLESLGRRLARLRRAKGWNQREMGERLGLRAAEISRLEVGSRQPRADLVPRLSEVFGVSSDYLLTGRSFSQGDIRLRERIEALETLPEPQRNHLVEFLDALISAHTALERHEGRAER